jgi:hypothetical protein
MKAKPEYAEGPGAWMRFQVAMKKVVAVPHAEGFNGESKSIAKSQQRT